MHSLSSLKPQFNDINFRLAFGITYLQLLLVCVILSTQAIEKMDMDLVFCSISTYYTNTYSTNSTIYDTDMLSFGAKLEFC